jgi:uncharacterized protein (TIGR02421 family)
MVDLERADRQLALLFPKVAGFQPSPLNLEQEKEKVLKDRTYNPKFEYNIQRNFDIVKTELREIKTDNSVYGKLLKEKINELLIKIDLISNLGKSTFTKHSITLYGKPSKELVSKARRILELKGSSTHNMVYNPTSAMKNFLYHLMMAGLNWKIKMKDMIAHASVNNSSKTLNLNKNKKYTDNDLKRLIVHEIGTHVTRAENGSKHKKRLFRIGFPDYLTTEEGLAIFNEEHAKLLTIERLKAISARVIAVNMSLKNSFSTVYNELKEHIPDEVAYIITTRTKRGLSDTSKPGAYTKDYVYLKGFFDVKKYLKSGGSLKKLYTGKIGIKHVNLLPKLMQNGLQK